MDPSMRDEGKPEDLRTDPLLRHAKRVRYRGEERPSIGGHALLRRLGRGGMGSVYLGVKPGFEVERAVKVLSAEKIAENPELRQRFVREARFAATIGHPSLLQTFDVDRDEATGHYYLVMEFLDGTSASRLPGGKLSESDALRLLLAATEGVAAAHRRGIVHRDLKPDNLLVPLNEDGAPDLDATKVADLGLARIEGAHGPLSDSGVATDARFTTRPNIGMGTPGYMPPEQWMDVRTAGKPADVFGLGGTLYALLTGRPPFDGLTTFQIERATLRGAYEPLDSAAPGVSPATRALVETCLRIEPSERFPDAPALAEALRSACKGLGEAKEANLLRATTIAALVQRPEDGKPVGRDTPSPVKEGEVGPEPDQGPLPPTVRAVPPVRSPTEPEPPQRRSRAPLVAGLALLATGAVVGTVLLLGRGGPSPAGSGAPGPSAPPKDGEKAPDAGPPKAPEAPPKDTPKSPSVEERPVGKEAQPPMPPPPEPPKPAPGLWVFTDPPGAMVTVDGREVGEAGSDGLLVSDVPPGTPLTVKAWLADHRPAQEAGVLFDGKGRREVRLVLERLTGFLVLEGGLPGAGVEATRAGAPLPWKAELAEGGTVGPVEVPVGEYAVTVTLARYEPWTARLTIAAGRTERRTVALLERDGTVALETDPPGAEVYEGGTLLGTSPLRPRKLAAGKHTLRLVHPDTDDLVREVGIRGDELLDLGTLRMPPFAVLDLSGLPEGVTAEVDGEARSGLLRRKAGEVEILWKKAKCRPQAGRVTLRSGEPTRATPPGVWTASPGRLGLSALPPDVVVTVDGTFLDRSGSTVEVEAGTHAVGLSRKGYRPVAGHSVTVGAEETVALANPSWVALVTVTPAVPNLPPPPAAVLAAQMALAALPQGFVRTEEGRIYCEKDGAEMVLVPAGEFTMGSNDSGQADEKPAHKVTLSAFLIDRYEVTVGQFKKFCTATPGKFLPEQQPESTDSHPVVSVDWNDAKAYAEWAGRRLPTEAEWEKAARGTDARTYPWGNQDDEKKRNGTGAGDGFDGLAPVGSFPGGASPCGALDMSGNGWEWCADWYDENYYGTRAATARDPQGPSSRSSRVLRGGRWDDDPGNLRAALRNRGDPTSRNVNLGFRAARGLP